MPCVEFLNILSYLKDKAAFEKRMQELWQRKH